MCSSSLEPFFLISAVRVTISVELTLILPPKAFDKSVSPLHSPPTQAFTASFPSSLLAYTFKKRYWVPASLERNMNPDFVTCAEVLSSPRPMRGTWN